MARFLRTSPSWTAFIWAKNNEMLARRCSDSMGRRVSDPSLYGHDHLAEPSRYVVYQHKFGSKGWVVMAVDCHQDIFLGDSYFVQPSDLFSWLPVLQHLMP